MPPKAKERGALNRTEWRVVMERPGVHEASPYGVQTSREMAEVDLRERRAHYARIEPSVLLWLESRAVTAWQPVVDPPTEADRLRAHVVAEPTGLMAALTVEVVDAASHRGTGEKRTRPQRVWLALSVANIWACGVASAQHDISAIVAATFFAVACWAFSSTRVRVALARSTGRGGGR